MLRSIIINKKDKWQKILIESNSNQPVPFVVLLSFMFGVLDVSILLSCVIDCTSLNLMADFVAYWLSSASLFLLGVFTLLPISVLFTFLFLFA